MLVGVSRELKVYLNRVSPDFEGHKIPVGISELKICFDAKIESKMDIVSEHFFYR